MTCVALFLLAAPGSGLYSEVQEGRFTGTKLREARSEVDFSYSICMYGDRKRDLYMYSQFLRKLLVQEENGNALNVIINAVQASHQPLDVIYSKKYRHK